LVVVLYVVEETAVCGWVVGLDDLVVDGVVETVDRFALVPDLELPVTGGDGGGDECPDRDRGRDWPVDERDFDGVSVGDIPHEGDTSLADREYEAALCVEVVSNRDGWWPTQTAGVRSDVVGGVAGPYFVWVVDGSTGVEPVNSPVRSLA